MKSFSLPDLGEGLHEVEIVNWHVSVGDNVVADQPLVSVETDKAVVEVPSPYSGRVAALHGKPGDIIPIGTKLAEFDDGAAQKQEDRGTVVGMMPEAETRASDAEQRERVSGARVKAIPAVRALARKLGVDLIAVDPSGPDGMITADDVKRYAHAVAELPAEPLHGVRRAMANKMMQAHAEIVPASIHDEADVESWIDKGDVTVRLIRAIVAGCQASPVLNAWYNSQDMTLRMVKNVDLGIAINTDDGLFVAVMRNVEVREDADLRDGLNLLKQDVEARAIPLEEMRGATITLSNYGVFGVGSRANLVVVPPQVAIVGAGTIRPRIVAHNGAPAVRRTLPLSLTFDHRVATGAEAARFLRAMIDSLEGKAKP
jgi:pyruvate dehydrogenase E2 component (dihydrolipoamide acetyltransferase)